MFYTMKFFLFLTILFVLVGCSPEIQKSSMQDFSSWDISAIKPIPTANNLTNE